MNQHTTHHPNRRRLPDHLTMVGFEDLTIEQQEHVARRFMPAYPPERYRYALTRGGCVLFRELVSAVP